MAQFENLFLSVGAMKAGTTWFYALLNRHPELHFSPEKEIHYFYHRYVDSGLLNDERRLREAKNRYLTGYDPAKANIDHVRARLRWVERYLENPVDDDWYRRLFRLHGPQKWACDFSNLSALLPDEAWPHINSLTDNLRVLYTMRDPVKRLWSHTKFHLQFSGEFEKLETWGPKDFENFLRAPHIWDNAEYGRILRRLKAGVPEGCLKVMFYEDVHADRLGALQEIEDFLGIAHHRYPAPLVQRRFTESAKHEMPAFFPELIAKDVARIRAEIEAEGYSIPSSWG